MKTIKLVNESIDEEIKLKDGNIIKINPSIRWVHHICCNCGAKHRWYIRAKKDRGIIIKPYRE